MLWCFPHIILNIIYRSSLQSRHRTTYLCPQPEETVSSSDHTKSLSVTMLYPPMEAAPNLPNIYADLPVSPSSSLIETLQISTDCSPIEEIITLPTCRAHKALPTAPVNLRKDIIPIPLAANIKWKFREENVLSIKEDIPSLSSSNVIRENHMMPLTSDVDTPSPVFSFITENISKSLSCNEDIPSAPLCFSKNEDIPESPLIFTEKEDIPASPLSFIKKHTSIYSLPVYSNHDETSSIRSSQYYEITSSIFGHYEEIDRGSEEFHLNMLSGKLITGVCAIEAKDQDIIHQY